MKAYIFDPLWDVLIKPGLEEKLKVAGIELVVIKEIAPLSQCKELYMGEEDRILCVNPDYVSWKLASDDYKNVPNLKAILGAATSTTWIDMQYAAEKGIPVCDIRNFSTEAVAEWAITIMLNLARQIPRLIKDGFPLDFGKDFMLYRGVDLIGKKVGIIGLGNIGTAIADRCAGLGMEVTYWSRSPKQTECPPVELEHLMAESDVIFPTMALNDETKTLISDGLLGSMKSSAMLVSIVHELFNQNFVLDMVKNGRLFGYGFEAEPKSFNSYEGNVWAAPAYAWTTEGSMNNSMELWVENMVNAAASRFPNKVN